MSKIIRKWYSHYEKEEAWLNEMSDKGLLLTKYTFCKYEFEDCEPGEYIFRIVLLDTQLGSAKGKEYIEFMEETGAEYIAAHGSWVYFRKKAADGPFDIYSDIDSRIGHYNRIISMWGVIGLVNLILGINNMRHNFDLLGGFVFINLFVACLLVGSCIPYVIKVRKLKKEKLLRE